MSQNNSNVIFWHICELNDWKDIVIDQYNSLIASEILGLIDCVYITFLGSDINNISWLIEKNIKFRLDVFDTDIHLFEKACLHSMKRWSQHNNSNILYIHTKGARYKHKTNQYLVKKWRKMLEYFLIFGHKACLDILKDYDSVGCSLLQEGNHLQILDESHRWHYSGNFWWSKTSYIKNLPDIPNIPLNGPDLAYRLTERWVLYPYVEDRHFEIFRGDSSINHYFQEELEYEGKHRSPVRYINPTPA